MDTSHYAGSSRPGHKMTGDRPTTSAQRREAPGYDVIIAMIDDDSRLAYAEIRSDDKATTATGFTERALAFYASHGTTTKRLTTDNARECVSSRSLKELLDQRGITHKRTRPDRPQTNGKIEHFHQTMGTEWAYGMTYASARARARALAIRDEPLHRAQTTLSARGKAPISRVRSEPLEARQLGVVTNYAHAVRMRAACAHYTRAHGRS